MVRNVAEVRMVTMTEPFDVVDDLRRAIADGDGGMDGEKLNARAIIEIERLRRAMDHAYSILCSGNPPHSPREVNSRRVLRSAGAKRRE